MDHALGSAGFGTRVCTPDATIFGLPTESLSPTSMLNVFTPTFLCYAAAVNLQFGKGKTGISAYHHLMIWST